jgi:hypothetical protein
VLFRRLKELFRRLAKDLEKDGAGGKRAKRRTGSGLSFIRNGRDGYTEGGARENLAENCRSGAMLFDKKKEVEFYSRYGYPVPDG